MITIIDLMDEYECHLEELRKWFNLYAANKIEEIESDEQFIELAYYYYYYLDPVIKENKTYEEVVKEILNNIFEVFKRYISKNKKI